MDEKMDEQLDKQLDEQLDEKITDEKAEEIVAQVMAKDKDKPELFREFDGVKYVLEEHTEEMVDMELSKQLWEHIELVSQKMNISIEEAGKIFDVDKEELTSLKFNAFMMDTIKQTAADVVKNYAEKKGLMPSE